MSVLDRMSDIVSSNINGVLDRAENPAQLARYMVREMETGLADVRTATANYQAHQRSLKRQLEQITASVDDWEERAETAVRHGRDDLARAALTEKHAAEEAAAGLREDLEQVDANLKGLIRDTQTLEARLKEAKRREQSIVARDGVVRGGSDERTPVYLGGADRAIARFDRYRERIIDLERAADVTTREDLAVEIDQLVETDALEKELEQLKSRVAAQVRDAG